MGATETVTILFTDLVGSTGLETRIGPGAAQELREEHFGLIRGALADAGGREVKNTGDGVMAAFGSAASAASCAVAIQRRFERRNRTSPEHLLVRIGISIGDATADGDDYFGLPVIEAARLCDRAVGGQILARDTVAHFSAGREGHVFASLGGLELKGIPEPVAAVEVTWEPVGVDPAALPLPARLQETPPSGFVGREADRVRLTQMLEETAADGCRVAVVSGEPGIGKTRLSAWTAFELRGRGATVLYGRCDEDLALPYGPWIEALRHFVEHAAEPVLRQHVGRHGGEIARLLPSIRDRVPDVPPPSETDPDTERYLLWGAILGLLSAAAGDDGVVLVLDDLHWADKPTLQLLRHVVGHGQALRTLIIGTYRESDVSRTHPLSELLADLRRERRVERVALRGLEEADVAEIMERAAGHDLDAPGRALAGEVARETGGNPFYTGEVLRHLLEAGAVYQEESGRWAVRGALSDLQLPVSVREVVGRRISRLGERTVKVLSVASVIGREFDVDLLTRVTAEPEDDVIDLLTEAVAASVLTESAGRPGQFAFAHAVMNHTLYEDLGTTRRARLHCRVAEALEEALGADPGDRVGELAQHWGKATTSVDVAKAVAYARLAGQRALANAAPDEAVRWFSQALEILAQQPDPATAQRCDLLVGVGEAQRQAGNPGFRETLLHGGRLADELGDADRAARAVLANNRGMQSTFGAVDQERIAALERALELDAGGDPARRARLLAVQAIELQFDVDHAPRRALIDEALPLARGSGDPRALGHVLHGSALVLWTPDTLALRDTVIAELEVTAAGLGDPTLAFWAEVLAGLAKAEHGDLVEGEAQVARARALADELGQPVLRWVGAYHSACVASLRCDLEAVERLADEALGAATEAGMPDGVMIWGAQVFLVRQHQGRAEEIIEVLEQTAAANPGLPALSAGVGALSGWLGRTAEARDRVVAAAADGFASVGWDQTRLTTLALHAEAAAFGEAREAAAPLYELLAPFGGQIAANGASGYGHVGTYLGLLAATLGRHERADEHFAVATAFHERAGMPLWEARGRLGWAEALAARGDAPRAREEAGRALEISRRHAYAAIERRAAAIVEPRPSAQV